MATHYPTDIQLGVEITKQEAWTKREGFDGRLHIPDFIRETIEQIAFEARDDQRIDKRSGVSQRLPITVTESVVSNAERRALLTGEEEIVPRISDVYAAAPSMTGKMELEYEGEQIGAGRIAKDLIKRAAGEIFEGYFVGIDFARAVGWFDAGNNLASPTPPPPKSVWRSSKRPELLDTRRALRLRRVGQAQTVSAWNRARSLFAQNKSAATKRAATPPRRKRRKTARMIYDESHRDRKV